MPSIHCATLDGGLLQRGFWIYVWRVTDANGNQWFYIGRTGDNSSPYAAPPYQRMGQHLGHQANTNALRARLWSEKKVKADDCKTFEKIAYGPVYPEIKKPKGFKYKDTQQRRKSFQEHVPFRDKAGALERDLFELFKQSRLGDQLLNNVSWKHDAPDDEQHSYEADRDAMFASFAEHFKELREHL